MKLANKMMEKMVSAKETVVQKTQKLMKQESGSAVIGWVMAIALTVAVFLVVNPQTSTMATTMMTTVTTWFTTTVSTIFS